MSMSSSVVRVAILVGALAILAFVVPMLRPDRDPDPTAAGPLRIAASLAPHAWMARQIGGEHVETVTVIPAGSSPETYAPSDAQISDILRGSMYLHADVPFEHGAWFDAIERSGRLVIVRLGEGIDRLEGACDHAHDDHDHAHDHGDSAFDPHTWVSPRRLRIQARAIAAALTDACPELSTFFADGLANLDEQLAALDERLVMMLAPHAGRAFMVYHPAWAYFADDYGLRQVAIERGGRMPSDEELTEIRRRATEDSIRMILVQPQFNPAAAATIAHSLGVPLVSVDPLAPDPVETLGALADHLTAAFDVRAGAADGAS